MVHRSLERLKLDRRLLKRAEWIPKEQLEEALASLPDATDKIRPPEEEGDAPAPASTPELAEAPTPPATEPA